MTASGALARPYERTNVIVINSAEQGIWPVHLHPGALRFARASAHYDQTIAFYRDIVELPVVGEFIDSFGVDGTIFGLPDAGVQLEIVRADGSAEAAAGAFDQLVLYLDDADAAAAATAPLRHRGLTPDPGTHEYWRANGAVSYLDPDGRAVVFAPWVYGREPDPVDRATADTLLTTDGRDVPRVDRYDGARAELRSSFEEAEDSPAQLDSYLDAGHVLVARRGPDLVGHLQLVPTNVAGQIELKNMAVVPELRGTGIGKALVARALADSAADRFTQMVVSTAAADLGNLRFYQRCGFRFASVERDAFTPATGYPKPIFIDGLCCSTGCGCLKTSEPLPRQAGSESRHLRYRCIKSSRASGSRSSSPTRPMTATVT